MKVRNWRMLGLVGVLFLGLAVVGCDKGDAGSAGGGGGSGAVSADLAAHSGGDKGPASIDFGGITAVSTDPAMVAKGKGLFSSLSCSACHQMNNRIVGPPLRGVTDRREPEWLGRMIKHPDKMVKEDPIAKELLAEYKSPMTKVEMSNEDLAAIIAYLGSEK